MSSEVIICSAPGNGSGRGFEPVATTMWRASIMRSPHARGVRTGKDRVAANDLDAAISHQAAERAGDVADHLLLAVDEYGPVELRLADGDAVDMRPLDLVQRMAGRHQHLFRRAASVRAGAAEVAGLDHRHRQAGGARRHRHAHAGVAGAQDQHIVFFGAHRFVLQAPAMPEPHLQGVAYFALTLDVMDPITIEAILN